MINYDIDLRYYLFSTFNNCTCIYQIKFSHAHVYDL